MYLNMTGWRWKHPADMKIDRPNGIFGMQLLLIQSKAIVTMGDQAYHVEKNTAFLVENCMPHSLHADGEEYIDDWIRFTSEQDDHAFLESLNLQWNVPLPLKDDTLSKMIAACDEVSHAELNAKNQILHHMMTAILLYLSECAHPKKKSKHSEYDDKLEDIRRQLYADPGKEWSIPEIAAELCISVSHFQRLYKARYGISCMQDIFMSRMEYAKHLLLETNLPAAEIAEKCGYQSYEHFSKSFAKFACMPPVRYRAKYKEG